MQPILQMTSGILILRCCGNLSAVVMRSSVYPKRCLRLVSCDQSATSLHCLTSLDTRNSLDLIILLCVLATPGNLFVVAVYFRRMKVSTRACLFALGIADTSICLNCILVITMPVGEIKHLIVIYVFYTSIMFSTGFLVFLTTERCTLDRSSSF